MRYDDFKTGQDGVTVRVQRRDEKKAPTPENKAVTPENKTPDVPSRPGHRRRPKG